ARIKWLLQEIEAGKAILAQNVAGLPSLGSIPLIVLTAGARFQFPGVSNDLHEQGERVWMELQRELVATSSNSQHRIVADSSHSMPIEKPDAVIKAVRDLVDISRRT